MAINQAFLGELQHENNTTKRLFERIPDEKLAWKPHDKSWTMGELASHIAEMGQWIQTTITQPELDFATGQYQPFKGQSMEEITKKHDENMAEAMKTIQGASDEVMMTPWKMRNGEQVILDMPRAAVLRGTILNHLYHHRGQLSVYMRMNDIPLPPMYGPTADEQL